MSSTINAYYSKLQEESFLAALREKIGTARIDLDKHPQLQEKMDQYKQFCERQRERQRKKAKRAKKKQEKKEKRKRKKDKKKEKKEKKEKKTEKKKKQKVNSARSPDQMEVATLAATTVPPVSAIQENVNALLTSPYGFGINNQAVPFPPMVDRFMLHLPLLGGHAALTWGVVMDATRPEVPPDFIFPPGEETSFRLSTLKSLANWRPTESRTCLLECVVELFTLYKEKQRELVKTIPDERLQFEISTIEEIPNVEFLAKPDEVCCLIPIAVTEDVLKKAMASNLTPTQAVYILVAFKPGHSTAPDVKLLLPPDWERCLGKVSLPAWSGEMCLIMFMPMVMESIEEQLVQWYNRRTLLLELVEALGNPLEMDTNKNRSIHFLHSGEVVFTITITLSDAFPGEQPELLISSAEHHKANSQSLQIVYGNYPYSPRWPAKEIAARIKKFLAEKLAEIKKRFDEDFKKVNTNIGSSPASPIDLSFEHYQ